MFHILHKKAKTPRAQYMPHSGEGWFDTYMRAVKQAFMRAWNWKVLWVWGILLPVGGMHFNSGGGDTGDDWDVVAFFADHAVWIVLGLVVFLCLFVIFWILGNVAKWGLARTLSEIQDMGQPEKNTIGLVWRRGIPGVWRLMIVDLIVMAFWVIVIVSIIAIAYMIFALYAEDALAVVLISAFIGLLVGVPVMIVVAVILRYVLAVGTVIMALTDGKIIASFVQAWRLMRGNIREVFKLMLTRIIMGIAMGLAFLAIVLPFVIVGAVVIGLFALFGGLLHVADTTGFFIVASIIGLIFVIFLIVGALIYNAITSLMTMDLWVWWVKRLRPDLRR